MGASQNYITEGQLLKTSYGMLTLASVFVLARIVTTQLVRPKRWLAQDLFIYFAYVLYLIMTVLYIVVAPKLYRVSSFIEGEIEVYPTVMDDTNFMIRIFFTTSLLFWCVLWTVKMSFLVLYKKLFEGLHDVYIKLWWAVVAFWLLSFIGAVTSHLTSCSSMHAWFTPPLCSTPRDTRAQIASLYYTYAVDVLTDMMIMALPIRVIWNLQMPHAQKFGVIGLFSIGIILIAVATLRVAQVGGKARSSSQPSSSWIALWGMIECSIAVIIGCCPAYVILIRNHTTPTVSYNTQGFVRQKESDAVNSDDVKLGKVMVGSNTSKSVGVSSKSAVSRNTNWEEVDGNQFELMNVPGPRDIVEELEEETPMGRRKIKIRRGAR